MRIPGEVAEHSVQNLLATMAKQLEKTVHFAVTIPLSEATWGSSEKG